MCASDAACKIACPHTDVESLALISNGLAINCKRFINNSAKPFVYEHELQDV